MIIKVKKRVGVFFDPEQSDILLSDYLEGERIMGMIKRVTKNNNNLYYKETICENCVYDIPMDVMESYKIDEKDDNDE